MLILLFFIRNCVEELVGVGSKCPECGAFAWSKDLKVNRRLADILSLCISIRTTIGNNDDFAETSTSQGKILLMEDNMIIVNLDNILVRI